MMSHREDSQRGGALNREESHRAIDLEQQVKSLQRHSERAKLCWQEHCEVKGFGIRDPSRHSPRFLSQFLDGWFAGTLPEPSEQKAPRRDDVDDSPEVLDNMIARIKKGQRESNNWKEMWQSYCDSHYDGVRDPGRHDPTSLRTFLEEFAPRMSGSGDSAPSRDRGRGSRDDDGPREAPMGLPPGSGVSALADRVKQMQRRGEKYKERWAWYCDNYGDGVRDPARHGPHFLQQYISMVEGGMPSTPITKAGRHYSHHPYGAKGAWGLKGGPSSAWGGYPGYPALSYGYPGYGAPGYAAMMYPGFGFGAWPTFMAGMDTGKSRGSSAKAAIADKSDRDSEESDDDSDSSSERGSKAVSSRSARSR